jgi:hypothetical protein
MGFITIFYSLRLEAPSTWSATSPYLYRLGTRWPSYMPGHWVPIYLLPTTPRDMVEVFDPTSTRGSGPSDSQSKLLHDWCLPAVSSSWGQDPSDHSPFVSSSYKSKGFSLINMLDLVKCTYCTYNTLLKILPFVSQGFAKQIMPILRFLYYNGSLVTRTVVSLTTSKF